MKHRKGWSMSCVVGKAREGLKNELWIRWSYWKLGELSSAHSPSFQSLHLCYSSFFNPSLALPTSQLILQPFRSFTYVRAHSPTVLSLLLSHRIFTYVTWRAAHDCQRRERSVAAAVWLLALPWRIKGFCTTKYRRFLLIPYNSDLFANVKEPLRGTR